MYEKVLARAKWDLSRRLGIPVGMIVLKRIVATSWPDASLGCPKGGKVYAQTLTAGYRLILSDGTDDFEYHADDDERVILCETAPPSRPKPEGEAG